MWWVFHVWILIKKIVPKKAFWKIKRRSVAHRTQGILNAWNHLPLNWWSCIIFEYVEITWSLHNQEKQFSKFFYHKDLRTAFDSMCANLTLAHADGVAPTVHICGSLNVCKNRQGPSKHGKKGREKIWSQRHLAEFFWTSLFLPIDFQEISRKK
jgi:hypothetical protein